MEQMPFYLLAGLAVIAALGVVVMRNPVYCALALAVVFISLAGLYVLLSAPFLAAAQVMIYAGAILILFVFVIMLLSPEREQVKDALRWQRPLAAILGVAFVMQLALVIAFAVLPAERGQFTPERIAQIGSTQAVGVSLFTDFLLPFEITSLLLLVAMVGVIVLAKKKV